jgi:trans-aconitate 2-methyltransferase
LRGDEVVLDAGCGSGRVTATLADRVKQPDDPGAADHGEPAGRPRGRPNRSQAGRKPGGRVYAVDVSPSMVQHARAALGGRATVLCQDLLELALPEPVDVVFSNATFHWIPDHDALFTALHRNMKPGARLLAQCGGRGNVDSFRATADTVAAEEPFARYFASWRRPWNYAGAEETSERLRRAGFEQVSCWLEEKPTQLADPRSFITTVCLVRHLDPLPGRLRDQFVDRILARCHADPRQALVLEYIRLNMTAVRG